MAVAREQIGEIVEIIRGYIQEGDILNFIEELRNTVAYQENQSYADTIEFLAQEVAKNE